MSLPFWTFEQCQKCKIMGISENKSKALLHYKPAWAYGARGGVLYDLKVKCLPQYHVFEHYVPADGTFNRCGSARKNKLLGTIYGLYS